jgi:murein DD-endopeptidase MepM/ murein hydrolase activator NlpD
MRALPTPLVLAVAATAATVALPASTAACTTPDQVIAFQAAMPDAKAAYFRAHRRARQRDAFVARQAARRDALAKSALACASGSAPLPFFPQGGVVGRDLYLTNTVDLDPAGGIRDPWCGGRTYDGHTGEDVVIRSFREQRIGVPVFAALDGQVREVQEGNKDTSYGDQTLPWDNHVIVDAGHGQLQVYGHLRRGSATVKRGDWVVAGQQLGLTGSSGNSSWPHLHFTTMRDFAPVDPWPGPCGAAASGWAAEAPVDTDLYVRDFTFSRAAFTEHLDVPWDDAQRTGTFVAGRRDVHFRVELGNAAGISSVRVRFLRPDGSVALDDAPGVTFRTWRQAWGTWRYPLDLSPGRWRLLVELDGRTLVDAPFDVVTGGGQAANRPPNAVTATVTRVAGVALCTVTQDLVREDPDYDIVRYRYVWSAGGRIVRAVTAAGLRDALPRTAPLGATCSVTPGDGRLAGPTAPAAG